MEAFLIEGGHPLSGTIVPQGAKNEALEVICATLLTDEEVVIKNIPDILDVNNLIKLLMDIGVKVHKLGVGEYSFKADELKLDYLSSDEFVQKCAALRGSVLMIGPLLGRFGHATVAKPGGDKIGRRRLICFLMRLLLQVLRISSWQLCLQKARPLSIMLPVSHIFSNYATCSTVWVQRFRA